MKEVKELKIAQRVEKHIIRESSESYRLLKEFCKRANNLYNHANYLVKKELDAHKKWLRYGELNKILKIDEEFPDYRMMPSSHAAQQTLKLLDKNWASYFKALKEWEKDRSKFLGKPKSPKYKKKGGESILIMTNQVVKLEDGKIFFPKTFRGFTLTTKIGEKTNLVSLQQIRFIPKPNHIVIEVVYKVVVPELKPDNCRYMSLDLGLNNLVAATNNVGERPFIVNGRVVKSINQYYNKKVGHFQGIAKLLNGRYRTRQIEKITFWRNQKIENYMHKASRYIVDWAVKNDISKIVIGYNKEWKQEINLRKKTNQNFVYIPFYTLVEKIMYKAEDVGIEVILTEESYTSGTSFLDNEPPTKEFYNKKRRIKRGLFKSSSGQLINSDVNGSLQILKKVFPNAYENGLWDSGCVTQPVKVSLAA